MNDYSPARIKIVLKQHEISAYAISKKTGISESYLSRLLSGKNDTMPQINTLLSIANAIPCDIREFFGGVP